MDWIEWHDKALTDHITLANQYTAQGYGFISLSIYGSITSPYYAAIVIRPAPSQQHHYASVPGNQMQQTFNSEAAQGYGLAIIAATGAASNPLFAAVFEPQNPIALTRWGLPGSEAQGSQVSYKAHGPFRGWVPLNYADNHILWRDANNQISLWLVDAQGNKVGSKEYGPFTGWVPLNYSDNHILWRDADNQISLWVVDDQGNQVSYKAHGPFRGWVPLNYADNRILWRGTSNEISLWLVDDQGNQVSYKEYGPFNGWVPLNYSDNHILWRGASNEISLWLVDDQGNQVSYKAHGPFKGWVPLNYADNRILWRDANNQISLWVVDDQGNKGPSSNVYGPFGGWVPLNYSDNHILWRDADNQISLWVVPDTIQAVNFCAKGRGLILRWAAAYGDSSNPAFAGVWVPNTGQTLWNVGGIIDIATNTPVGGESASTYGDRLNAEQSVWCRPAFFTLNASGQYLSLFVDNQIGPYLANFPLTSAQYQLALEGDKQLGYFPVCVQAAGADQNSATFAAIFATSLDVIAKQFTPTGPVANQQIDQIMQQRMATYSVRQAALAIVHGTQLVYVRGYTLAEPDWPITQPTTFFGLASVTKVPTALAIFQMIEKKMLSLGDKVQDILQLFTPSGDLPSDPLFSQITIQHLLEHKGGLNGDWNSLDVRDAFKAAGHPISLPVTAAWVNSYIASLKLLTNPGATQVYSSLGYYLLAQVVGTVWSQYDGYEAGYRPIDAYQKYLFNPLSITRIRRGTSLVTDLQPDDTRSQNIDLGVGLSIMSDARPVVSAAYGTGANPTQIDEGGGGLSAAATDLARLIAILISQKDSPALKRATLTGMLSAGANLGATENLAGYGFDGLRDLGGGQQFYGQKGGSGSACGAILQFNNPEGWGFTLLEASNGPQSQPSFTPTSAYPDFPPVMTVIAPNTDWGSADLFPQFGMPSL